MYRDGKYLGHAYRETRGSVSPIAPTGSGTARFEGRFYVLEETMRDMRSAARAVDRSGVSRFAAGAGGSPSFEEDEGFPALRGLPSLPAGGIEAGTSWVAPGERSVDLPGGRIRIPFLAEYRSAGPAEYLGKPALKLVAKFATRYQSSGRAASPPAGLERAAGTHDLEIYLDAAELSPLHIRDRFDETFFFAGGGSERRAGFNLVFYEGSSPIDRDAGLLALRGPAWPQGGPSASPPSPPTPGAARGQASGPPPGAPAAASPTAPPSPATAPAAAPPDSGASLAGEPPPPAGAGPGALLAGGEGDRLEEAGVEVGSGPEGIVLRVRDLRFVADSDRILDAELWRLDAIAAALSSLPGRRILVEGHSAAVGKAAGELELSGKRAAKVASELAARGIDARLIMYRGLGSSRPIAPNDSEEGRARNRRVEITVLDY